MLDGYPTEIIERARKIKLLVLDVDGVLSDGRIIYDSRGNELKNFDVNDGLGIFLLKRAGFKCVILTAKASSIVLKRAKELRIDKVYQNFHDKHRALKKLYRKFRVKDDQICFVGDDIIDVPVLKRVGLAVCPPNAMDEVKASSHFITQKRGGRGAVREVCDLLLKAQDKWSAVMSAYLK